MSGETPLLIDTQAVICWALGDPNLSAGAAQRMRSAVDGGEQLFISAYTLPELRYAAEKARGRRGRVGPDLHEAIVAEMTDRASVFTVTAMSAAIVARLGTQVPPRTDGNNDPGDRIIVATALQLGADLVTSDDRIRREAHVPCIW